MCKSTLYSKASISHHLARYKQAHPRAESDEPQPRLNFKSKAIISLVLFITFCSWLKESGGGETDAQEPAHGAVRNSIVAGGRSLCGATNSGSQRDDATARLGASRLTGCRVSRVAMGSGGGAGGRGRDRSNRSSARGSRGRC